jgi:hypothetical protein
MAYTITSRVISNEQLQNSKGDKVHCYEATLLRLVDRRLGALLEGVGETTFTTSLPVLVPCHEDTGTTGRSGALSSESLDLAVRSDLVVLEDSHLDLLPLVLDLLGGGLIVSCSSGKRSMRQLT